MSGGAWPTAILPRMSTSGVARNTGLAFLTQIVTAAFTAGLTIFLVRRLGPDEYGLFSLALGIAGLLFGRSGAGDLFGGVRDVISGSSDPVTIQLTAADDFDPFGDDRESADDVGAAIDGDPATAWTTESYDNRDITVLKPGVGLVLSADQVAQLHELILTSPTNDWSASFYVAETNPGSFDAWGEPVATLEGIEAGTVTVDLGGTEGGAVLIWITNQGDGSGGDEVTIAEARLTGVPE